jgi:hypothetical protein
MFSQFEELIRLLPRGTRSLIFDLPPAAAMPAPRPFTHNIRCSD